MTKDTVSFLMVINSELWQKFKVIIPRPMTLNDAIVDLIQKKVEVASRGKQ